MSGATATGPVPAATRTRDAGLTGGGYLGFALAMGLSALGDAAWYVTLAWSVTADAGPARAGAVLALASLPRMVTLLGAGAVVDSVGPRRVMAGADLGRCAVMLLAAAGALALGPGMPLLVVAAAGLSLFGAFFIPASGSLRAGLLPRHHLVRGNALYLGALRGGQAAGGPVGGMLMALGGIPLVAAVNAVTYAVAVVAVLRVRVRGTADTAPEVNGPKARPEAGGHAAAPGGDGGSAVPGAAESGHPPLRETAAGAPPAVPGTAPAGPAVPPGAGAGRAGQAARGPVGGADAAARGAEADTPSSGTGRRTGPRPSLGARIGEGLRVVAAEPRLRAVIAVIGLTEFAGAGPVNIGVALIADRNGSAAAGAGLLLTAFTVGAAAGFLLTLVWPARRRAGRVLVLGITGQTACLAALAWAPSTVTALAPYAGLGLLSALVGTVLVSCVQRWTPETVRGRVLSIQALLIFGAAPMGNLVLGVLVESVGMTWATLLHALVALTAVVMVTVTPLLREARLD
ncbi:MFS transporter [Streptomyces lancefieldiae]|uniref:MFS transporter n=1 Tax=Streptomyces lancefieldiae TaxID=3075520 RepID=A0ABU3AYY7_9ACTN|nr:MFS transporter [Streptomyces sp. DSM 40712]MDT0615224.1 MFS transporter [Streptomyces sp. DSM 40712]